MQPTFAVLSLCLLSALADAAPAQGGRGRGRAEEIQNRVGAFFSDTPAPPAGDKAADLTMCDLVRAASGYGQPVVLYLFDGGDDKDVREQFERTLFASDELGIQLRCFHCGRIDLAKADALKARYGKQAPLFVVFDKDGKASEPVSMSGYKASATTLGKALVKAAQGAIKPSIEAFAKEYGGLVRDLEQAFAKKKTAQERQAKAGADKQKRAEADKDLEVAEAAVQKLLDKEKALLTKVTLPERPADAQRLGGGRGPGGGRPGG
jgi:hypothetical protein